MPLLPELNSSSVPSPGFRERRRANIFRASRRFGVCVRVRFNANPGTYATSRSTRKRAFQGDLRRLLVSLGDFPMKTDESRQKDKFRKRPQKNRFAPP
jgi:hypothetical protein